MPHEGGSLNLKVWALNRALGVCPTMKSEWEARKLVTTLQKTLRGMQTSQSNPP